MRYRWSTARATSARRQRPRRGHALHRVQDGAAGHGDGARHRRGHRRLQPNYDGNEGQEPSCCRRGSRTCWSTARPASPSAWRPTSRRTTCARSTTAVQWMLEHPDAEPRGAARGAASAHQGPRLPDGATDPGPQGHRGRLPHRPRLDHHARGGRHRGDQGPHLPGGHRAAVPGATPTTWPPRSPKLVNDGKLTGIADIRDETSGRTGSAWSSCSSATPAEGRAEQPVQAHPAAGHVRRNMLALVDGVPRTLRLDQFIGTGIVTRSRSSAAHPVPAAQGRGAKAHILRGCSRRSTHARRGHRP
jgi:hypothetical protein